MDESSIYVLTRKTHFDYVRLVLVDGGSFCSYDCPPRSFPRVIGLASVVVSATLTSPTPQNQAPLAPSPFKKISPRNFAFDLLPLAFFLFLHGPYILVTCLSSLLLPRKALPSTIQRHHHYDPGRTSIPPVDSHQPRPTSPWSQVSRQLS